MALKTKNTKSLKFHQTFMRCLNTKLVSLSNNMLFDDSSQSYANRESIKS